MSKRLISVFAVMLFASFLMIGCKGTGSIGSPLSLSGDVSGQVGGNGYIVYAFKAKSGTAYTATLKSTSGDADLDVFSDTIKLGSSAAVSGQDDVVSFTAPSDKIFVLVKNWSSGSMASYTLSISSNK